MLPPRPQPSLSVMFAFISCILTPGIRVTATTSTIPVGHVCLYLLFSHSRLPLLSLPGDPDLSHHCAEPTPDRHRQHRLPGHVRIHHIWRCVLPLPIVRSNYYCTVIVQKYSKSSIELLRYSKSSIELLLYSNSSKHSKSSI